MAGPTKDELVREILARLSAIEKELERVATINEYSLKQNEEALRERLRTDERHEQKLTELTAKHAATDERCRLLEKGSDRTWQVWLALIGAAIALAVSLIRK